MDFLSFRNGRKWRGGRLCLIGRIAAMGGLILSVQSLIQRMRKPMGMLVAILVQRKRLLLISTS